MATNGYTMLGGGIYDREAEKKKKALENGLLSNAATESLNNSGSVLGANLTTLAGGVDQVRNSAQNGNAAGVLAGGIKAVGSGIALPVAAAADGVGATLKAGGAIASGVADAARTVVGTGSSALSQIKNEFLGQPAQAQSVVAGPTKDQMDTYRAVNGISVPSRPQAQSAQQPVGIQVPQVAAQPIATTVAQPAVQPNKRYDALIGNPYVGKPNVSIDENGVTQITNQALAARPTGVSGYTPTPEFIKIDPNTMSFADIAAARSQNKITQANLDQGIKLGNLDVNRQQNDNNLRVGLMNADSTRMNANTSKANSDLQAQELGFKIGNYAPEQAAKQAQAQLESAYKNSQIDKNKAEIQKLGQTEGAFPSSLQTAFFNSEAARLGDGSLALKSLEQARAQRSGAKVDQSGDLQVGPATPAVDVNSKGVQAEMAKYRQKIKDAGNNPAFIKEFTDRYGVAP